MHFIIYRPESCLTTPETLLPVSICCLGYQTETKPRETRFRISTAPANDVRRTHVSVLLSPLTHSTILPLCIECLFLFFLLAAIQL